MSVQLFKVKNTPKQGKFRKFLKVTTQLKALQNLKKVEEKVMESHGI